MVTDIEILISLSFQGSTASIHELSFGRLLWSMTWHDWVGNSYLGTVPAYKPMNLGTGQVPLYVTNLSGDFWSWTSDIFATIADP